MVTDGITRGMVMWRRMENEPAPSMAATSCSSSGMFCRPATYMIIIYPIICQFVRTTNPQKPYFAAKVRSTPILARTPFMISCQIYPNTMPPIKFGIKNAVLKNEVPFNPFVSNNARINASRLTESTDTTVNFTVNQNAFKKSELPLSARI